MIYKLDVLLITKYHMISTEEAKSFPNEFLFSKDRNNITSDLDDKQMIVFRALELIQSTKGKQRLEVKTTSNCLYIVNYVVSTKSFKTNIRSEVRLHDPGVYSLDEIMKQFQELEIKKIQLVNEDDYSNMILY